MTITQEKIDDLRSTLKVNLKIEDYAPQVKKRIRGIADVVQLPGGFRKGSVERYNRVKRLYGDSALIEELNEILNEKLYKYIDENKLAIVASPIPAEGQKLDLSIQQLKDVEFTYEIGHAPDVDLSYLQNTPEFIKYVIKATNSMIDDEMLRIRNRFSTFEYPETASGKDLLTLTIEELDANGNSKTDGINTSSSIALDLLKKDYQTKFENLKKHESFSADIFDLMERDREGVAKNLLNMNDLSRLDAVGNHFKLTLDNITRNVPAVINEEFFQKVYGENGPKTEEEMRQNIRKDLEAYFDGQTDSYLVNELFKGMMEHVSFPLPDEFLKRWILLTNEKPISEETVNEEYPQFAKSLRWSLIQKKIKQLENIEVTDSELHERVRQNLIHQLYGYGLSNIGQEWIEQFVHKQLADKKVVSETRDQILEDKVLAYVKSKAKLTEKEISLDEFKELLK